MHVLIAEDDIFFQKFYSTELKELGYEVTIAANGVQALESMHTQKPDVLILDIIMPEKDGFEVLEEMSQDTSLKTIPVLVFSTLGQEQDVTRAMDLGAKDFINKNFFDFDSLVQKLKAITGP